MPAKKNSSTEHVLPILQISPSGQCGSSSLCTMWTTLLNRDEKERPNET